MKNHRFLWLRNRTTNNRKCEKARNIKEKRTIEMFSTVSKPHAAHLSSPSADLNLFQIQSTEALWLRCFLFIRASRPERAFRLSCVKNIPYYLTQDAENVMLK